MMSRYSTSLLSSVLLVALGACGGQDSQNTNQADQTCSITTSGQTARVRLVCGQDSYFLDACTVEDTDNGANVTCSDGTSAMLTDGEDGAPGEPGEAGPDGDPGAPGGPGDAGEDAGNIDVRVTQLSPGEQGCAHGGEVITFSFPGEPDPAATHINCQPAPAAAPSTCQPGQIEVDGVCQSVVHLRWEGELVEAVNIAEFGPSLAPTGTLVTRDDARANGTSASVCEGELLYRLDAPPSSLGFGWDVGSNVSRLDLNVEGARFAPNPMSTAPGDMTLISGQFGDVNSPSLSANAYANSLQGLPDQRTGSVAINLAGDANGRLAARPAGPPRADHWLSMMDNLTLAEVIAVIDTVGPSDEAASVRCAVTTLRIAD